MQQEEKKTKTEVAQLLNQNVMNVLTSTTIIGFEKAFLVSESIGKLKDMLTSEYMLPIMKLQGNRLGFKTDKDDKGGYPVEVVKNCLIEAVLMGVQPTGNQFNIIAGNCYITKEGFGYLLKEMTGLTYEISFELPRINADKTGAAVNANIVWTYKGVKNERKIDLAVKMNSFMGADAVIGKATRKARAWLFTTISGVELGDGDIEEGAAQVVSTTLNVTLEDLTLLFQMKEEFLTPEDSVHIKRIIDNKEASSYKKAQQILLKY